MKAPVIIFAYNRQSHLENLISALQKNPEFKNSDVFIFVDGPKLENDLKVDAVRRYVKSLVDTESIPNLSVTIKDENIGLANSIISGVTEVILKYKKAIIVEDDIIVTPDFLNYMNNALDYYEENDLIWSVGAYSFLNSEVISKDIFLNQRSSSYAWATWENRWEKIDWEIHDYDDFKWNFSKRKSFNSWGNDKSLMLDKQMKNKIDSWAIRFDYNMWKYNMFNILPARSRVHNTGHDGSGTHSWKASKKNPFSINIDENYKETHFENVSIDRNIKKKYEAVFRIKAIKKLGSFMKTKILNI